MQKYTKVYGSIPGIVTIWSQFACVMGWAEMIRKVYEVDPLLCPSRGGTMKVIAFLTDYAVVDRIINHLKLSFVADRPSPLQAAYQEVLMAAEAGSEYSL